MFSFFFPVKYSFLKTLLDHETSYSAYSHSISSQEDWPNVVHMYPGKTFICIVILWAKSVNYPESNIFKGDFSI